MEIKIDTQKDSKEELKQVINLLKRVVGEEEQNNRMDYYSDKKENYEEKISEKNEELDKDTYESPSQGLFNIFDSSNEVEEKKGDDIGLEFRRKESEDKESEEKEHDNKNINVIPY